MAHNDIMVIEWVDVNVDNLGEVMACGADGVAVISAAVRGDIPANMKHPPMRH